MHNEIEKKIIIKDEFVGFFKRLLWFLWETNLNKQILIGKTKSLMSKNNIVKWGKKRSEPYGVKKNVHYSYTMLSIIKMNTCVDEAWVYILHKDMEHLCLLKIKLEEHNDHFLPHTGPQCPQTWGK